MAGDVEDLRQRLADISSEIGDLALARLRAALDGAEGDPAAQERRLTRARRSVDKAYHLLGQAEDV
ncbi:MAG TPA: hypothetical protein VMZ51_09345 [Acidimicrobiales bacterium]|nr:hypothetical protein [Acidimicrobiales bacterium]